MTEIFDVTVIGAGVVGCALAREFALRGLSTVLVDAAADISEGTSKANTAILHTGFDATPGTLESRLVAEGYGLLLDYARRAGIAVEPVGAVLVAWDEEQRDALPKLAAKAAANGYDQTAIIDAEEVYARIPELGPGALGGLTVPGESIIDPWSTSLAFANDAVAAGTVFLRHFRVDAVAPAGEGLTEVRAGERSVTSRWVVNAAGLYAGPIDALFGYARFTTTPRRGELIVFDKATRAMAPCIILPVPTSRGKGVLVAPTVFGNVMLGPTSEDITDPTDTSTTRAGLDYLLEKGRTIMPTLLDETVTATYAGLRAATEHGDYVVDVDAAARYACVAGIRSTGLTSSLALAAHVADAMAEAGQVSAPTRRCQHLAATPVGVPNIGEAFPRPYADADLIASDPAYGEVVCFCERVTRGEIRDALASPVPPEELSGLKRRTRATMGRCQGFYCGARIQCMIDEGKNSDN